MTALLQAYPTCRFADEVNYTIGVAAGASGDSQRAESVLLTLAERAGAPELKAAALTKVCEFRRARGDVAGVQTLLEGHVSALSHPSVSDTVEMLREWARRRE